MRINVDLVLFLYLSSACGFSNKQVMEGIINYIEGRINAESKFRRDDFGTLFSEIGAIKIMLQQLQENKSEREEKVKILTNDFKEEKTLNARFQREISQLQIHVQDLKTKTDQISASREDILNGIEFLKDQNEKKQETYNLSDNKITEIQRKIQDLHHQFEQTHTAESESLNKIRNDIGEMKSKIEHLKTDQEMCLENIRTNSDLTASLQEKLVSGKFTCSAGKHSITTEKDEQKCKCTVFSCPVISTPSTESPLTTYKSSTSSPNILNTTYKSCLDLYRNGFKSSAVYGIEIQHGRRLSVYCDMTTDGGGWTVFQRRQDGSVDFFRDWNSYKAGFGILTGEFWLGNEYLNILTDNDKPHELRIELEDYDGYHTYAKYSSFKVRSESMNYKLEVSGYTGSAGDSLFSPFAAGGPQNEMEFSTKDKDNDKAFFSCASAWQGGWWFNKCSDSDLNGPYSDQALCEQSGICIVWASWKGFSNSMKFTEMKVR